MQKESGRTKIMKNETIFEKEAEKRGWSKEYAEVRKTAKSLETKCLGYAYIPFQTFVSLKILMANNLTTVVELPTGCGKSYIAAIVAEQYRKLGLRIAIVTTHSFLAEQLKKMLGPLRFDIKVMTMQKALTKVDEFDAFVLDEADACLWELGSIVDIQNDKVAGFWDLLRKRTVLLTANISSNFDEIMTIAFGVERESYLKFEKLIQ